MTPAARIAQQILSRLGELRAGKLSPDRRTVALEDLEQLARDYLASAGNETLGRSGPLHVSLDAARAYGAVERVHDDDLARRELAVLAYDAKEQADGGWRIRRRSTDLDISLRVAVERTEVGVLHVVTHAHVRPRNSGGRRG